MKLSELFALFNQDFSANDQTINHVSIDTRTIKPGDVYVAFKGEAVDGHNMLDDAKSKGAIAAVVMHKVDFDLPQCVV